MKSIKKITKAVAGSALLVGATLAGGAAMGAAANGSSGNAQMADLGDYPHPFVGEDGQVQSTVVVGADAKTVDVVGATNIAGQLGNDAMEETTVSGMGSYGWSASNGVTLDTQNDALYMGDALNTVRDTLTGEQLSVLEDTEFRDDGGDETEITSYLNIGNQEVTFGNSPNGLDNEDPVLHVPVPAEGDVDAGQTSNTDNYLFSLQANMEDDIDFSHKDVAGEEIELFGRTYTVANDNEGEDLTSEGLLLYGSSQEVNLDSGQSTTVTVDGEEHTIELVGVTDGSTTEAVLTVDGERETAADEGSFTVGDTEVRVDDIFNFDSESSNTDSVTLSLGSEELVLKDGEAIQDSDGDDIEGTHVEINGAGDDFNSGDGSGTGAASSIEVYLGSQDDEMDYLAAGDSWSHPLFENLQVNFGGLNPNVQNSDNAGEYEVTTSGDEDVQLSFTADSGDSATVNFVNADPDRAGDSTLQTQDRKLADTDGDAYVMAEGEYVAQDQYLATDAGDFSHMWEVTDINLEGTPTDSTVELKDAITGDTVEVDLDAGSTTTHEATGKEIIDGQTYYFHLDDGGDAGDIDEETGTDEAIMVTYGGASYEGTGDAVSLYTAHDTQTGGAVAFYDGTHGVSLANTEGETVTVELPSTESTDAATYTFESEPSTGDGNIASSSDEGIATDGTPSGTFSPEGQDVTYHYAYNSGTLTVGLYDGSSGAVTSPRAMVMHPEDDDDTESTYVFSASPNSGNDEIQVDKPNYMGTGADWSTRATTLESNDDVDASYDAYGAYAEYDGDDQHSFTLWQPNGQAVAGVAVTGADGSLSAGGSSGATSMSPTGWGDHAALDSDGNVADLKQNQNLILVGGPAVNDLTAELADGNKTWTGDQYEEGDAVLDLVHNTGYRLSPE